MMFLEIFAVLLLLVQRMPHRDVNAEAAAGGGL